MKIYASITWNGAIEFYSQENIEIPLIRISIDMWIVIEAVVTIEINM